MYRKRRLSLFIPLVLVSGLFSLLQTLVTGDLAWPPAAPPRYTPFILTSSTADAASSDTPADRQIPPHAVWRPWGGGWECQRGYRREGERCIAVEVPPHAFLDYFGHDWQCQRGYRRESERCVPVQVPEHAYLAHSGHGWLCNDGYQRVDQTCVPLPGARRSQTASPQSELAQLATQVYANPEAAHDRQTIERLQRQLQRAGYDPGPSDGILGPRTLAALRQFLEDKGLTAETQPQATPGAPDS